MLKDLYISNDIFFREIDGVYVFLDATKDRYFTLSGNQSTWFTEIYRSDRGSLSANAERFSESLVRKEVFKEDSSEGKAVEELIYALPASSIYTRGADVPNKASAKVLPQFVYALLSSWRIRKKHRTDVGTVIDTVKDWKTRLPKATVHPHARATELTLSFHALTPYFFTTHDACFFRSLCLVKYLSLFGLSADWVFAVRLCPFSAHCWVEFDGVVLNEDFDKTLEYKPIMIV